MSPQVECCLSFWAGVQVLRFLEFIGLLAEMAFWKSIHLSPL